MKLEALVNDFQTNVKFTKTVEQKMLSFLSNEKVLLRYAFFSIMESIRNDPERHKSIFISPQRLKCYNSQYLVLHIISNMYHSNFPSSNDLLGPDPFSL
jgi:hypothetical protein